MSYKIHVACPTCSQVSKVEQHFNGPDKHARCPKCQTILAGDSARVPCGGCGRYVWVRRRWYGLQRDAQCPVCDTHVVGEAAALDLLGPAPQPPVVNIRVERAPTPAWIADPVGWAADAGLLDDDPD